MLIHSESPSFLPSLLLSPKNKEVNDHKRWFLILKYTDRRIEILRVAIWIRIWNVAPVSAWLAVRSFCTEMDPAVWDKKKVTANVCLMQLSFTFTWVTAFFCSQTLNCLWKVGQRLVEQAGGGAKAQPITPTGPERPKPCLGDQDQSTVHHAQSAPGAPGSNLAPAIPRWWFSRRGRQKMPRMWGWGSCESKKYLSRSDG